MYYNRASRVKQIMRIIFQPIFITLQSLIQMDWTLCYPLAVPETIDTAAGLTPDVVMASAPGERFEIMSFTGSVFWTCLACNHPQVQRVQYASWRVQCANPACRRRWELPKIYLESLGPGRDAYYRAQRKRLSRCK